VPALHAVVRHGTNSFLDRAPAALRANGSNLTKKKPHTKNAGRAGCQHKKKARTAEPHGPELRGRYSAQRPKDKGTEEKSTDLANDQYCQMQADCHLSPNEKVEQLAVERLTMPQDAIASLLQRLVRHAW